MRQDPPSLNVSNKVRTLTSHVVWCVAVEDNGVSCATEFSTVVEEIESFLPMSLSSLAVRST